MSFEAIPPNYFHQISKEISTAPDDETLHLAYTRLKDELPPTRLPEGYGIDPELVQPDDLLYMDDIASIISAGSGNYSTDARRIFHAVALGINMYETPSVESKLDRESQVPLIRHNRMELDEGFKQRIRQNALKYYMVRGDQEGEIDTFLDNEISMGTLWLASCSVDSMCRLDTLLAGKLLDSDKRINPQFVNSLLLVNAVAGAGEMQAHNDRLEGRQHKRTVTGSLENEATGFVAKLFGFKETQTVGGACAALGKAINLAETFAASRKKNTKIILFMSGYDGPTKTTQEAFSEAGFNRSDSLPYLYNTDYGYTESPGALATVAMTREFVETMGISLQSSRLIRSVTHQGESVYGVDSQIPEKTYEKGFELLQQYYPSDYKGTIVVATHGANTTGWLVEIKAIQTMKKKYFPESFIVVTSTQPQIGHQYPNRSGLSLEIGSRGIREGVLPGMARAKEQLWVVNQEHLQEKRRRQIEDVLNIPTKSEPLTYGEDTRRENARQRRKAKRLYKDLQSEGIFLCFSSMKIPQNIPLVTVHTGLNGESACVLAIPIR